MGAFIFGVLLPEMIEFSLPIRQYPAKLLLFGEHLLLLGSTALAIPVPAFAGRWDCCNPSSPARQWQLLCNILPQLTELESLKFRNLEKAVNEGWYFNADIPMGYGMGSSGALCAAIFDAFGQEAYKSGTSTILTALAEMESAFHGKSSGIDPLTSYLNQPVLISDSSTVQPLPHLSAPAEITVFLVDTGQERHTAPLVQWFRAQLATDTFQQRLESILPVQEAMIQAWLDGNSDLFLHQLRFVSQWQYHNMQPMLPQSETLRQWWIDLLGSDHTFLKICGAGGGGFLLGFTRHPEEIKKHCTKNNLRVIFPFLV